MPRKRIDYSPDDFTKAAYWLRQCLRFWFDWLEAPLDRHARRHPSLWVEERLDIVIELSMLLLADKNPERRAELLDELERDPRSGKGKRGSQRYSEPVAALRVQRSVARTMLEALAREDLKPSQLQAIIEELREYGYDEDSEMPIKEST